MAINIDVAKLAERRDWQTWFFAILAMFWLSPAGATAVGTARTATVAGNLLTAFNLTTLRDIGSVERPENEDLVAVSPAGDRIAFIVSRADPTTNGYHLELTVIRIDRGAPPLVLDHEGELIFETVDVRGLATKYGYPASDVPRWSPDGRWIAYLKRLNGVTQVWRVRSDGGVPIRVSSISTDVEGFRWEGVSAIAYWSRDDLHDQTLREREGRSGFLLDDRFVPTADNKPALPLPVATVGGIVDFAAGTSRPLGETDIDGLRRSESSGYGFSAVPSNKPSGGLAPIWQRWAEAFAGKAADCADPQCPALKNVEGVWNLSSNDASVAIQRVGWAKSQTALYIWPKRDRSPRRLLITSDLLAGCAPAVEAMICARESGAVPRHLVRIDFTTGAVDTIFDPNPNVRRLALGQVQRMQWRNDDGDECFGDLVLPPDYNNDKKLPLIVVQYRTRGFLRGGTGDEYPIHVFAGRGYAVLSVDRPVARGERGEVPPSIIAGRNLWDDRREILSSITTGVDLLIRRGIADPKRIGITGLSDGSTTARFGLINTSMFAAASLSTCCFDTRSIIYGGERAASQMKARGFPSLDADEIGRWAPQSFALSADKVHAPVLMQLADSEYLIALEAFYALRARGRPAELFVFPDEYHLKWQPAHRLAIYERNLDWFDYWLRGKEDENPAKRPQYSRWEKLKRDAGLLSSAGP